jgi:NADH dehydrogenase/NADH:ubiquinone oxidoreductase subunit G
LFEESTARLALSFITKNIKINSESWNGINFLSSEASQVGCSTIGLNANASKKSPKFVYAVGDALIESSSDDCFIVYQGHQGNSNALKADLILPGSAYTEKEATFINTEGRSQRTQKVLLAPGKAKEDSSILSAIIKLLNQSNVNSAANLVDVEEYNVVNDSFFVSNDSCSFGWSAIENKFIVSSNVNNFYLADPISKASPTMAKCSKQLLTKNPFLV